MFFFLIMAWNFSNKFDAIYSIWYKKWKIGDNYEKFQEIRYFL